MWPSWNVRALAKPGSQEFHYLDQIVAGSGGGGGGGGGGSGSGGGGGAIFVISVGDLCYSNR